MKFVYVFILTFTILLNPYSLLAFETDQFNLPPVPLADIGDEFSQYVEDNLIAAVAEVNNEISAKQICLDSLKKQAGCGLLSETSQRLVYLRSGEAVANAVFKRIGEGSLTITKTGKWFKKHKFAATPDRYMTSYIDSIYVFMPFDFVTLSPTVRVFGTEFGADKIEHMFQQGHQYYAIERKELKTRKTAADAEKKAISWGRWTERTYYGLLSSGVYSNADLYANYAGMKFYEGLTAPLKLGKATRPAILELQNGSWKINGDTNLRESLIKPFISDHLNEALNPSSYAFNVYPTVKRVVRDQACPEWRKLMPDATKADLESRSASLEKWNGEDYGFVGSGLRVTLADVCFGMENRKS